jgi:hypothetical protein
MVMSGFPEAIHLGDWPAVFPKPFETDRLLQAVERHWR